MLKSPIRFFLTTLIFFAIGCGSNAEKCQPAQMPPPGDCPPMTFVDTTTSDNLCVNMVTGEQLCRVGEGPCYICSGTNFTDGCLVRGGNNYECVHDCTKC